MSAVRRVEIDRRSRGRRWAMLASFVQKAEFDAVLTQNPFQLWDRQTPAHALANSLEAMSRLPTYSPRPSRPLPAQLSDRAALLSEREMFRREYEAKADISLRMVSLKSLIPPQALVDLDYVDERLAQVETIPDAATDFDFAFPAADIPEPVVHGNSVIFSSTTPNLIINPIPTYYRTEDGYEITVRATSRPNYLYVAELADRLVVINGVHKALTLLKAGRDWAPVVIRRVNRIEELGVPATTLLARIGDARPPLVSDFLEPVAVQLERRRTATLTRVVIQVDQVPYPLDPGL